MNLKTYYTIDYDKVVAYRGYLDSLYGTVSIDDTSCGRYEGLRLGQGTWQTEEEAYQALVSVAVSEFKAARLRMKVVKRRYRDFKRAEIHRKPKKNISTI